jgi:hypothetical protein
MRTGDFFVFDRETLSLRIVTRQIKQKIDRETLSLRIVTRQIKQG